jgi:hypothetical protein
MTIKEFNFESAAVGIAKVNGRNVAVYDELEFIMLLRKNGMSGKEAREYVDSIKSGSRLGEMTPIFMTKYSKPNLTNNN